MIAAGLCALLAAYILFQLGSYSISRFSDAVGGVILCLLFLLRRKFGTITRVLILMLVGLMIGFVAVLENPMSPDGFLLFSGVMLLSFMNLQGKRAYIIPAIAVGSLLAMAVALWLGVFRFEDPRTRNINSPGLWIIIVMTLSLLGVAMSASIHELKKRLLRQIDKLEVANQKLFHQAYIDFVSGIPNKRRLEEYCQSFLDNGLGFTLLVIDAVGFRNYNALRGHEAGDDLVRGMAMTMQTCAPPQSLLARLTGVQFAICMPPAIAPEQEFLFRCMEQHCETRLHLSNTGVKLFAAWASAPRHGASFAEMLKHIEVALSAARRNPSSNFVAFTEEMEEAIRKEDALIRAVKHALDNQGFHAVYQAKVRADSRVIEGFEGLARMRVDDGIAPSPGEFIPILHEQGWMPDFNWTMLRIILRDTPKLVEHYGRDIRIAINVSPLQFLAPGFPLMVKAEMDEAKVDSANVILEITEEVFASDLNQILAVCREIQALGIAISLDDFGSGFSSLSYLRMIPFDEIKIDRSFVRDIANDDVAFLLFNSICRLGGDLKSRVVVEGIENEEQLAKVRETTCDSMQGFLFARPQPIEALIPAPGNVVASAIASR